jgi:hypothetical protein
MFIGIWESLREPDFITQLERMTAHEFMAYHPISFPLIFTCFGLFFFFIFLAQYFDESR